MKEGRRFDLEDRLIDFSVLVIQLSDNTVNSKAGNHLAGQIIRSGTSPALNYGEAQAAESRKDFIHKMKICLKELRETFVAIKIIDKAGLCNKKGMIEAGMRESKELIAIFMKSISTAEKNNKK